ncbi:hypothetical protein TNCV_2493961 [Trichonephila clavipes]|uniref:Uncharacterized protein n=1 Tax=Trichonephila clavipes TaxID=2585209 RepID=A0A8X6RRH8_TRICX|nr:hypothetical protein TNCV_2493961 [Trichonephila clavipes]
MHIKSVCHWHDVEVWREGVAQATSSSLDRSSKLRSPLLRVLVFLQILTLSQYLLTLVEVKISLIIRGRGHPKPEWVEKTLNKNGTWFHPSIVTERDRYDGPVVVVCGGITLNGQIEFHVFDRSSVTLRSLWQGDILHLILGTDGGTRISVPGCYWTRLRF